MSAISNNNLSEFQVIVESPIWLGSRIWEPRVYDNPPAILIKCAERSASKINSPVHFGLNGVRVNPFAKFEMVNLDDDESDNDSEESTNDESNDEEVSDENAMSFDFKSIEDLCALNKKSQLKYLKGIRNAPASYSDDIKEEYNTKLYDVLLEYVATVTDENVVKLINEILTDFDD